MLSGIGDIASTSFITLYCHAMETLSENPIISDMKSVEIMTELNKTFSRSDHPLDRILASGRLDKQLVVQLPSGQKNTMTMPVISSLNFRMALS